MNLLYLTASLSARIQDLFPTAAPEGVTDSKRAEAIEELKSMSFDELIQKVSYDMVQFAIHLVCAILVFYVGKFIIKKLYQLTKSIMTRRQVEPSLAGFVLSMIKIVLYFVLIVTVIGIIGLETSSFLALFASAGVAVGMALSGTLQNFAGGVLILLLKPYKVGDYIETQGLSGTVKEIQIFNTIICTPDNKSIIIPNGGLSTGTINNWSKAPDRRVDWTIGISYGDSFETARAALLKLFEGDARILRPVEVFVEELADSSVNLKIRAWVATADYWAVYYDYNERIYTQLPSSGVSFPFPQLDVHIAN